MTELSKSGSASRRSVMPWQTVNLRCLWYSERIFGTIFAHNLRISKFSVRIFHIASLPMESFSEIILTVSRQSARTSCFTQSILLSVLLVTGLHILLDPFGIVCVIKKHELSTLFLSKLAVATQNIPKVSYQAWLKISNSFFAPQYSCLEGTLTVKSVKNAAFQAVRRNAIKTIWISIRLFLHLSQM